MMYKYRGKTQSGAQANGVVDAVSETAAAGEIMKQGITPISIVAYSEKASWRDELRVLFEPKKIELEELIIFCRQMYALSRAGVPLIRAFRGLLETMKNPVLIKAIREVLGHLETGMSLAMAFSKTKMFMPIVISMVHVGENTGELDETFNNIAKHLELERDIKRQIQQATRYPMMVIGFIAAAMVVVNYFVIPSFSKIFEQFHGQLPMPTKILLSVSQFFIDYKFLLLAVIIGVSMSLYQYVNTDVGRMNWDQKKLKLPLIGVILERILLARFARTFSMLSAAGIPVLKSLNIVAQGVGNVYIGKMLMMMHDGIERGDSFTRTAASTKLFPPLVLQMISVGEETGSLDPMLIQVADFYDEEVNYSLKKLSAAIEPIILVVMGGMVLMLALGIFLPLWDLSSHAGSA